MIDSTKKTINLVAPFRSLRPARRLRRAKNIALITMATMNRPTIQSKLP